MKLTNKQSKILELLKQWQSEEHIYDLMRFHSMEFYDDLGDEKFLEEWFDVDLTQYFEDKFPSFATEGGTGYIAFWKYQEEAPIIRIDTYGEHPEILAGSLNDLVCLLIHYIDFNDGGWWYKENKNEKLSKEDILEKYNDACFYYNKKNNTDLSIEEFSKLIDNEREEFKQRAIQEGLDFISEEEINKNRGCPR